MIKCFIISIFIFVALPSCLAYLERLIGQFILETISSYPNKTAVLVEFQKVNTIRMIKQTIKFVKSVKLFLVFIFGKSQLITCLMLLSNSRNNNFEIIILFKFKKCHRESNSQKRSHHSFTKMGRNDLYNISRKYCC